MRTALRILAQKGVSVLLTRNHLRRLIGRVEIAAWSAAFHIKFPRRMNRRASIVGKGDGSLNHQSANRRGRPPVLR